MAGSQNGEDVQAAPAADATQTPTVAPEAPAESTNNGSPNPRKNRRDDEDAGRSKKQRRRRARSGNYSAANGTNGAGVSKAHGSKNSSSRRQPRRHSISKAARDPRDEPAPTPVEEVDATPVDVSSALAGSSKTTRSPSPVIDFDGLSRPSIGTRNRLEEGEDDRAKRLEKIRGAVRTILECVGEDPDRAGLVRTPDRYARALLDFTQGYQQNVRNIVNNAIFHEGHNEMVIVKDIEVYSLCEHHMVPFTGKMHIGYIPFHSVIGISKLPRIAEMFSRRLQIQERLTKDVANTIMEILQPQGVAVVMESSHLCMVMRGVQKTTATTITSCVLGCFESKEKTRNEFLNLVGLNRS